MVGAKVQRKMVSILARGVPGGVEHSRLQVCHFATPRSSGDVSAFAIIYTGFTGRLREHIGPGVTVPMHKRLRQHAREAIP